MHTPHRDGSCSPLPFDVSSQGCVRALDHSWIDPEEKLDFGCFVPAFWPWCGRNHRKNTDFNRIQCRWTSFRPGSSLAWKARVLKIEPAAPGVAEHLAPGNAAADVMGSPPGIELGTALAEPRQQVDRVVLTGRRRDAGRTGARPALPLDHARMHQHSRCLDVSAGGDVRPRQSRPRRTAEARSIRGHDLRSRPRQRHRCACRRQWRAVQDDGAEAEREHDPEKCEAVFRKIMLK